MSVPSEDISAKNFSVTLRGYDKDEVDAYLAQLAARFKDPYAALGQDVTKVLKTARDTASGKVHAATQEAENLLRRAREEADTLLQKAQGEASDRVRDAQAAAAEALETAQTQAKEVKAEADRYYREIRSSAEATATRQREEAETYAQQRRDETDAKCRELLEDAVAKHRALKKHEEELRRRIEAVAQTVTDIRGEMGTDAPVVPDVDELIEELSDPAAVEVTEEAVAEEAPEEAPVEAPEEAPVEAPEEVLDAEAVPDPAGARPGDPDAVWSDDEVDQSRTGPRPTPLVKDEP